MMLYPPVADLVDKVGSKYQLVNLVAHRARHISMEAEQEEEYLDEKPVSIAINEVYAGKLTMKTPDPEVDFGREKEAEAESEPEAESESDSDEEYDPETEQVDGFEPVSEFEPESEAVSESESESDGSFGEEPENGENSIF